MATARVRHTTPVVFGDITEEGGKQKYVHVIRIIYIIHQQGQKADAFSQADAELTLNTHRNETRVRQRFFSVAPPCGRQSELRPRPDVMEPSSDPSG